ncbi:hypothetical protein L6259_01985 [Candidatus Parcubacteria bacterium]|nr:hypothetical protein [Candidatus Parcubacteria bacterium]
MDKKIIQKLNNYTEKYLEYKKWLKKESAHYVFYYLKNTKAENDINKILKCQERAFKKIVGFLKVKASKHKIRYFLYPSENLKEKLMGDNGYAQSIYHNKTIHVVYTRGINPLGEHEDTHILSLPLGLSIGFFQEGLAEYMSSQRLWRGKKPEFWIKEGLKKEIIPNFKSMLSHTNWTKLPDKYMPYYYISAASFVEFLIIRFGKKNFILLYKKLNRKNSLKENTKVFNDLYKTPIRSLQKEWQNKVKM